MGRKSIEFVLEQLIIELQATAMLRDELAKSMTDGTNWMDQGKIMLRLAGIHDALGVSIPEYIEALQLVQTRTKNIARISIGIEQRKLKQKVG